MIKKRKELKDEFKKRTSNTNTANKQKTDQINEKLIKERGAAAGELLVDQESLIKQTDQVEQAGKATVIVDKINKEDQRITAVVDEKKDDTQPQN